MGPEQSQPLRIGYLVQQFPPETGAGPARVAEMATRWTKAGARVTVVTGMPNRPEARIHEPYRGKLAVEEEWEGIRVLRSWLYASPRHGFARTVLNNASFMATGGLHALLRGAGLDVLIASSPPFFPHLSGAMVGWMRRIPLVLEVRDLWPDYLVGMGVLKPGLATRALFALERRVLHAARRVVVTTPSFRERIVAKGVDPARIDEIPNGVDTALYHPETGEAPPLEALRRRPGEWTVGYLGNFGAGQDLAQVVDAAALLERTDPEVRVVMAGDGPDRERVTARAAGLGLRNLSIHPAIPKGHTRAFYNACDLCLVPLAPFPVLQETVPAKIFEVMACERPLVASLAGEGARIVERSRCGVATPPGDANALAGAIRRMRATPEAELRAMGRRGRAYVAEHHSRDTLAARYLAILHEVARPRRATPAAVTA